MRRVISGCFLFKKLGAVRGEQLMGDLPKERLMPEELPFAHLGLDYFGPRYVRQGRSNVNVMVAFSPALLSEPSISKLSIPFR